jgi:peroxiredoxin/uncharacterized membrane protein YphA (DoxX/SURF4 family)
MNTILVVARVGVAAVFALAAVAKLADMPGSRAALDGFNVPARLVPSGAFALPLAELAAAVMLVIEPTVRIGAALAILLLLAFIGGIASALRRGVRPECHCFGQLQSEPVGTDTLVRNVLLAAVGVLVLAAGPGPAIDGWARTSSGDLVALAAVSLVAIVLAYVCYSQWRGVASHVPGAFGPPAPVTLKTGQALPSFTAVDEAGETVSSAQLLAEAPRNVLVFTSASCGPCLALLPELARWRRQLIGRIAFHVLSSGEEAEAQRLAKENELPLFLDPGSAAANAVGVYGTPSAIAVDEQGRVIAPMAMGAPPIEALIRVILKRPPDEEPTLKVHQVAATPAEG